MMHNALILFGILAVSFVITLCFWNQKENKDFRAWWDSKGLLILMLVCVAISVVGFIRGWFYRF